MNLYAYLGLNPVNRLDALGLSWGFEDEIDEFMDDYTGNALYALGTLNEGAKWVALGLNTALSITSSLLGLDVFESVELLASGRGGFWDAMNIVAAVTPIGKLGKAGGAIGSMFKWKWAATAGKVVSKFVGHHTVPTAVLKELRTVIAASAEPQRFEPRGTGRWDEIAARRERLSRGASGRRSG
jgi:hypothetical protein